MTVEEARRVTALMEVCGDDWGSVRAMVAKANSLFPEFSWRLEADHGIPRVAFWLRKEPL